MLISTNMSIRSNKYPIRAISTMVLVAMALVASNLSKTVGPFNTTYSGTAIIIVKMTVLYRKNRSEERRVGKEYRILRMEEEEEQEEDNRMSIRNSTND